MIIDRYWQYTHKKTSHYYHLLAIPMLILKKVMPFRPFLNKINIISKHVLNSDIGLVDDDDDDKKCWWLYTLMLYKSPLSLARKVDFHPLPIAEVGSSSSGIYLMYCTPYLHHQKEYYSQSCCRSSGGVRSSRSRSSCRSSSNHWVGWWGQNALHSTCFRYHYNN